MADFLSNPKEYREPKSAGSGQVAQPTYRAQLAREILEANAKAQMSVDEKRKGIYFGKR